MNTHVIRIRHDFSPTVVTRELEPGEFCSGGWQFGRDRGDGKIIWYAGSYKTEKLALGAAKRRVNDYRPGTN